MIKTIVPAAGWKIVSLSEKGTSLLYENLIAFALSKSLHGNYEVHPITTSGMSMRGGIYILVTPDGKFDCQTDTGTFSSEVKAMEILKEMEKLYAGHSEYRQGTGESTEDTSADSSS